MQVEWHNARMFLFLKLVLAHMIADFILQFEELYRLKLKSWTGHFLHALIHGMVSFLLLFPYLQDPFIWVFVAAITVIHYFQDQMKYSLQAKDPKNIFWYFTADQIFHVLFLASIFLFPAAHKPAGPYPVWNSFFQNSRATLCLILFIGVSFKAAYFLHALRKTFFKNTRPDHFITSFEMTWGLIERPWIAICFLAGTPFALALSPVPGLLRPLSPKTRGWLDFFLNYGYAASAGWLFNHWIKL